MSELTPSQITAQPDETVRVYDVSYGGTIIRAIHYTFVYGQDDEAIQIDLAGWDAKNVKGDQPNRRPLTIRRNPRE